MKNTPRLENKMFKNLENILATFKAVRTYYYLKLIDDRLQVIWEENVEGIKHFSVWSCGPHHPFVNPHKAGDAFLDISKNEIIIKLEGSEASYTVSLN